MPKKFESKHHDSLDTFKVEDYGKPTTKIYKYTDHGEEFLAYLQFKSEKRDQASAYQTLFDEFRIHHATALASQLKKRFSFGKYQGERLESVYKQDPDYCRWVAFELSGCSRIEASTLEWMFYLMGSPASRDIKKKPERGGKRNRYHRKRRRGHGSRDGGRHDGGRYHSESDRSGSDGNSDSQ